MSPLKEKEVFEKNGKNQKTKKTGGLEGKGVRRRRRG
jgi:hypothetical protein